MRTIDGLSEADPRPASDDASFRRYFRVKSATQSYIVMDAPPAREDCKPFIAVAGYLESMQLNAPRVLEANLDDGYLLLTDLGSTPYLDELERDRASAELLYDDALQSLAAMQERGSAFQSHLPPYDEALLRFELSLFHDWLCGTHLGIEFSDAEEHAWQSLCDYLVRNAFDQPQVFVHRDYHSRNLMICAGSNPGIIDFQDSVEGAATYDLVSFLKDCYIKWPAERINAWATQFCDDTRDAGVHQLETADYLRHFDLMGVQRHLKAAGIFARLNHRDGKARYLNDVPRTLSYIVDLEGVYEELVFLVDFVQEKVLPGMGASQ